MVNHRKRVNDVGLQRVDTPARPRDSTYHRLYYHSDGLALKVPDPCSVCGGFPSQDHCTDGVRQFDGRVRATTGRVDDIFTDGPTHSRATVDPLLGDTVLRDVRDVLIKLDPVVDGMLASKPLTKLADFARTTRGDVSMPPVAPHLLRRSPRQILHSRW